MPEPSHRPQTGQTAQATDACSSLWQAFAWLGAVKPRAREQDCDLRLFDFEAFGGFGKEVRSTLREAANQLSNKLSHAQHLDEVTWTTKNWHGLQMQRLSVVLHTAVAWQTVNELACGESGTVHGAKCIAVLNGVA